MSLWQKLNTLFRASAQEPLEALVDANSIRIFQQELRDAEQAIARSKRELACVIAEKNRLQRHNQALRENLAGKENQAKQALQKGEDALALELAEVIADDEQILSVQDRQLEQLKQQEKFLRKQLKQVVRVVASYHAELRLARANQSAENAVKQLRGYSRGLSSQMVQMEDSLQRIRQQQQRFSDFDEAMMAVEADCNGQSLNDRLKAAGIARDKADVDMILERIRTTLGTAAKGV